MNEVRNNFHFILKARRGSRDRIVSSPGIHPTREESEETSETSTSAGEKIERKREEKDKIGRN